MTGDNKRRGKCVYLFYRSRAWAVGCVGFAAFSRFFFDPSRSSTWNMRNKKGGILFCVSRSWRKIIDVKLFEVIVCEVYALVCLVFAKSLSSLSIFGNANKVDGVTNHWFVLFVSYFLFSISLLSLLLTWITYFSREMCNIQIAMQKNWKMCMT